jgi:hypothetical protein
MSTVMSQTPPFRYRYQITARSGKHKKDQAQPGDWVGDTPGVAGFFLAVI